MSDCIHRVEGVAKNPLCTCDRWSDGQSTHYAPIEADKCSATYCPHYNIPNRESRGLGDTVHKVTHAIGIDKLMPGCGGCNKRRQKLNDIVPYNTQD